MYRLELILVMALLLFVNMALANDNTVGKKTPQAPFTIEFKNYIKSGSGGANLYVYNSSSTEYKGCSIELGDNQRASRWYLRNETVLDANGRRSYPTFVFRDREGVSPPTPNSVTRVDIQCSNPTIAQEIDLKEDSGRE